MAAATKTEPIKAPFTARVLTAAQILEENESEVGSQLERELIRAWKDCKERETVGGSRTVSLSIQITPKLVNGVLDAIELRPDVKSTIPKSPMRKLMARATADGHTLLVADMEDEDEIAGQEKMDFDKDPGGGL